MRAPLVAGRYGRVRLAGGYQCRPGGHILAWETGATQLDGPVCTQPGAA